MRRDASIQFLREEYLRLEPIAIQSKEANELIEQRLQEAKKLKHPISIASFSMLVGIKHFYAGNYAEARQYFDEVNHVASLPDEIYFKNLYWICAVHYLNGRMAEPLKLIQEALNFFVQKEFTQYNYLCLSLQASLFLEVGFYDESLMLQEQCAQYYLAEKNISRYIVENIQIANTFYSLSKFEQACNTLLPIQETYREILESSHATFRANYWKNLADIYLKWEKPKECFLYYDKVLKLNVDSLHPYFQGSFYISYGQAFLLKKDLKQALKYSLLSLEKASKINSSKQKLIACQNIAEIYLKLNDLKQSRKYLEDALEICKLATFGVLEAGVHEIYAKWYNVKEDYKNAQKHLQATITIKDEINAKESDIRIEAIRAFNELKFKEKELARANKELALQKQELELTTYYLNQKNSILNDLEHFVKNLRNEQFSKQKICDLIQQKIHLTKISTLDQNGFKEKLNKQNLTFITSLRKKYPTISKTEAQIASLLVKGMNTKEIADLLVMEPRSIEMHRYRLRKKLEIDKATDLQAFLLTIPFEK